VDRYSADGCLRRREARATLLRKSTAEVRSMAAPKSIPVSSAARRLYDEALVVDTTAPGPPVMGLAHTTFSGDARADVYRDAGVTLAGFTVGLDHTNSIEATVKLIAANRRFFLSRPERYVLIDRAEDVRRAKRDKKMGVCFGFQGCNGLLGDLNMVELYRRLGVTHMLLAYNDKNLAGDGCHEVTDAGLSRYGRDLVAEMNRVGMILDVTHMGLRSSLDALEVTRRPPIFSHSTPKKFATHDRNISDEQIRACAAKDGVICLTGVGLFMDRATQDISAAKIADTIDYVVQLVGARHAGIGLDYVIDQVLMANVLKSMPARYGAGDQYPADGWIEFASPAVLPEVTEQLLRRGYKDDDVRGILGENYLRVFEANSP
jgi:membrane dipeptidase